MNSDALRHVVTILMLLKISLFSSLHVNSKFMWNTKCGVRAEYKVCSSSTMNLAPIRTRYQINNTVTMALNKACGLLYNLSLSNLAIRGLTKVLQHNIFGNIKLESGGDVHPVYKDID